MENLEKEILDKDKLEEILFLSRENNAIIKKMRRLQKIQNTFRIIYWITIIAIALGAYYFFQPILDSFFREFDSIKQVINNLSNKANSLPDVSNIRDLINGIGN